MQHKSLFEYAVIRIVPRVEREEFINVGIVLYCADQKFLQAVFEINEARINAFAPNTNTELLHSYLCAFKLICNGDAAGGPISQLPAAERFRWLTAARSTMLQTSSVHSGLCLNAEETLNHLYNKLVLEPI